ncbi:CAP-associated domain-containing protein [Bacillus sp. FJAT-50079]|uniref:CAP domain-containing protein n=1 Tax=Bacillus sp. FJAT-50079 TaxID=2833577 RepID=UPI0024B55A6C|nr:CAP-associated domain-containing protein [Bacillus sp. FJAT-50079]
MKRFLFVVCLILVAYLSKSVWLPYIHKGELNSKIMEIKDHPNVTAAVDSFTETVGTIVEQFERFLNDVQNKQEEQNHVKSPILSNPTNQMFAIYNIEIGTSKNEIEQRIGVPKRVTENEYGVKWHTYHEGYHHFVMVSYDADDRVNGLYTNQDLISSASGIKLGSTKDDVLANLGSPLTKMRKGMIYYQLPDNGESQVFQVDNSYITVFYDKHEHDVVTALQVIRKDLEEQRNTLYSQPNPQLKEGFEYQLFDLTNATRVNHQLNVLEWDDVVKETARKHSLDMAENHYFDHVNLQGKSPFDRMEEDHISFRVAGENLAYGQFSSIFAHEGLMNSLGHRENILKPDYTILGIGVAFNDEYQPYYTENFINKGFIAR